MKEKIQEFLRKNSSLDKVEDVAKLPVVIKYKKRGDKSIVYHNLKTGLSSDTFEDICADNNCVIIDKSTGSSKYPHFWKEDSDITLIETQKSYFYGVAYKTITVNIDGIELKLLIIYNCQLRTTIPVEGEKRHWEEISRMYIDVNKNIYLSDSHILTRYEARCINDYKYEVFPFWNMFNINNLIGYQQKGIQGVDEDLLRCMVEFNGGVCTLAGNNISIIGQGYSLKNYLEYNEPFVKTSKKQSRINELVSFDIQKLHLPNIRIKDFASYKKTFWYEFEQSLFFANISKVKSSKNENICCIRICTIVPFGDYYESCRIYISDTGEIVSCKKNNFGDWVNISLSLDDYHWHFNINYVNYSSIKGTLLEYLIPLFELKDKKAGVAISNSLKHPCIEKIYKSEFKEVINYLLENKTFFFNSLKENFGPINENGKNAYSILGLNKVQAKYLKNKILQEYSFDNSNNSLMVKKTVANLKEIFNKDNLNDINIESIISICDFFDKLEEYDALVKKDGLFVEGLEEENGYHIKDASFYYESPNSIIKILKLITKNYSMTTMLSMLNKIYLLYTSWTFEKNKYTWSNCKYEAKRKVRLYYDYLTMVDQIEDKTGMTAHFSKIEDVQLLHDSVIDIYNYQKQQERLLKQKEINEKNNMEWQKKTYKWDKWEYSDDNYSIISPKHPGELSREGLLLRHCVGGYIQRVLDGRTNIMFLRKNEDIETPFFTIEISNDGAIEQIHGFSNRNMDTEPNIIYFVNNWEKHLDLKSTNFNKVR